MTKRKHPTNRYERRLIAKKKYLKKLSSKPKAEKEDDTQDARSSPELQDD